MTRSWSGWAIAASALAWFGVADAAPPSAAMLANACGGCHGTLGASAGPSMPTLAAQSRKAIVEAMNDFRSGERPSTVMGRLAKGYTDEQIEMMADYFSRQKPHPYDQEVDMAKADKGDLLQEKHCSRCHVDDGRDFKNDAPIMAGQWLKYLQLQMSDYVSGKRPMDDRMAKKFKNLSADDLDAIANFYASTKQGIEP